ncbi:hypothetical protein [Catellatospora sp. NPDC049609]|uniref:DUF4760 domain-containing protein n=1 Tax=Catellatospora sp. NPDC049609 TaxID=3155505 RepID=UPI00342F76C8
MSPFEVWSLVAAFVGIVVNIVVFAALAWQIRLLARQVNLAQEAVELDHERRRKQATQQAVDLFLSRQAELRRRGIPFDHDMEGVAEILTRAAAGDQGANQLISEYTNLWEMLANSVRYDVLHLDVVDQNFGRRAIVVAELYRPWADMIRSAAENPDLMTDLDWLVDKIRARRGIQKRLDETDRAVAARPQ